MEKLASKVFILLMDDLEVAAAAVYYLGGSKSNLPGHLEIPQDRFK